LAVELVRKPHVVSIQEGDVLSSEATNSQISRGAQPMSTADPRPLGSRALQGDLGAGIRRTVVYQQGFQATVRLGKDTLDRPTQEPLRV
jgi:hypothetical protein